MRGGTNNMVVPKPIIPPRTPDKKPRIPRTIILRKRLIEID
jgi:hypothetical protein